MPRHRKKYNERIELGFSPDGKRKRVWIRADTKLELEALKAAAVNEYKQVRNPQQISLQDYAQKWHEIYHANKSLQTQSMYSSAIKKLSSLGTRQLKDITTSDLQKIINDNWQHPRVCEILKLTLKQIYKQAIKDGIIYPINLAEDLSIPKRTQKEMRFISDAEMEKILKCKFAEQDRFYIDVLRSTGMRPSEALALRWEDIDFKNKQIHVRRAFEYKNDNLPQIKPTKTEVDRFIPLSSAMENRAIQRAQDEGYVFLKRDGQPFTKSSYKKMYRRIFSLINEVLGPTDIVMYSFRHTFATFLYYHGVRPGLISTKKAAQIMGHSEKIFLDRYTHIDDSKENLSEIVDKIR